MGASDSARNVVDDIFLFSKVAVEDNVGIDFKEECDIWTKIVVAFTGIRVFTYVATNVSDFSDVFGVVFRVLSMISLCLEY